MASRYENRLQIAFALIVGAFLLANLFALTFILSMPTQGKSRAVVMIVCLAATSLVALPCALLVPRWLGSPLRRLVGEAERAPVANAQLKGRRSTAQDETEFVLETFQAVVAELRSQQRELTRLRAVDQARARSAENFNARIIASLPSGLIAFDAAGRANVINAPARALLGIETETRGLHFNELRARAPELVSLIEETLSKGRLFRRVEMSVAVADKPARRLGVTVAPLSADTSSVEQANEQTQTFASQRGALCLITDLTEVTQLRETVALKKNLESLGEMSAGLAHEFKNALATLHGYAQLWQNFASDARARASADALLTEVRALSAMVTAFLNFARPQPLQKSEVALSEIIESCAAELKTLYAARRVELNIGGEFPRVCADERLLRQAILNLLRNAAEAIPETHETRRVTVRGEIVHDAPTTNAHHADVIRVEITDTGDGIAPEDLQRVFIPFFTTKSDGTGIGLALAHRIISDHGGALVAANSEEGGARFTLTLPLAAR
jgi:two-component system sensor histidine kinase AtoS